ncbi:MAG TPA: hypothetical protein VFP84_31060 [Kofleriaceae bacterium]|nr:hypothetical protein [Kofleriaceae bacterium]
MLETPYLERHGDLAGLLETVVNPHLPTTLISRQYQDWIASSVCALPAFLSSFFGYEVRLADPAPRADFLLCVHKQPGGAFLASTNDVLPARYLASDAWRNLRAFASAWMRPGSPLHDVVENMWLELDVEGPFADVPVPFTFFKPTGHTLDARGDLGWVLDGIHALTGQPVARGTQDCLRHVVRAMPPGGHVFQVAPMPAGRGRDAVRLCIRDVAPDALAPFLARIGWPGDAARLATEIGWLRHAIDGLALNLDVSDGVAPKLGLECYLDFNGRVLTRTKALLDELVERGLCLPGKRADILRYHGWTDQRAHLAGWPVHLFTEAMLLRPDELSVFWRKLHHVKLVVHPDRALEAKAYLLVCHSWVLPALIAQARQSMALAATAA